MFITSLWMAVPTVAGIAGPTADGTWDCVAIDGAPIGTVILSDKTYAFVKLDGRIGSYGKLLQVGAADYDLPHFVVIDGFLKDQVGAVGLALTGPRGNNHVVGRVVPRPHHRGRGFALLPSPGRTGGLVCSGLVWPRHHKCVA